MHPSETVSGLPFFIRNLISVLMQMLSARVRHLKRLRETTFTPRRRGPPLCEKEVPTFPRRQLLRVQWRSEPQLLSRKKNFGSSEVQNIQVCRMLSLTHGLRSRPLRCLPSWRLMSKSTAILRVVGKDWAAPHTGLWESPRKGQCPKTSRRSQTGHLHNLTHQAP